MDTLGHELIPEGGGMAANTRQPRQFTLADAMALVAAVAVGLALSRVWTRCADERRTYQSTTILYPGPLARLRPVTKRAVQYWPVVAALSPTLLALRTRRPRPRRRRLFAPPGVTACATATIAIALQGLMNVLHYLGLSLESSHWKWIELDHLYVLDLTLATIGALSSMTVGIAVAAAWGSTALAGRWQPESSWIDRAGRVVGLLWLALIPIRLHFNFFFSYLSE
jgi:hypothetical protein